MPAELIERLLSILRPDRSALVALSGFSGSGKSTMARELARVIPNLSVIESDLFWRPECNHLSLDWSSIDRSRIRLEVLEPALKSEDVVYTPFDWESGKLGEKIEVSRSRILLLEGIGILHPDLSDLFDLKIWVEAPFHASMENGIKRDRELYGLENEAEWREIWIPNERAYFDKFRPDLMADIVVPWFGS